MDAIRAQDFSFAYATAAPGEPPALQSINITIPKGAFCLLVGATGCGKSTLLRACKPELAPAGTYSGTLSVLGSMAQRGTMRPEIAFVDQDPETQIVCDTVWHELAFALENVGVPDEVMHRRVAETACFFGIDTWIDRQTADLSGGEKQLLNLAAAVVARPHLLLLDEPCAQLDPAARRQFMAMLAQVHAELGCTVVMATHTPEEVASLPNQVVELSPLGQAAPLQVVMQQRADEPKQDKTKTGLLAKDVFVQLAPNAPWVLKGLDLSVASGSVCAVVGGNGSGKTTLLRTLAGLVRSRRGKIDNPHAAAQAYLPQDPKALFVCDTVEEELQEWRKSAGYTKEDIAHVVKRFCLEGLQQRHPYDLSGGQRQCLALAKLALCNPKLMLLDEPTKGLDAACAATVARLLRSFAQNGATVVFATHDLDFAAACADTIALLFDGQVVCVQSPKDFFDGNLVWRPHESCRLYGALL